MGYNFLWFGIETCQKDYVLNWFKLYDTYLSKSSADSKNMKIKALMEYQNYDTYDELVEMEHMVSRSYFWEIFKYVKSSIELVGNLIKD